MGKWARRAQSGWNDFSLINGRITPMSDRACEPHCTMTETLAKVLSPDCALPPLES
jgi:hypothetical protein